ncbi:biotin/lipoyl-containing protein, partial [Sphingomonas sp.]|uniref:ATP-binding protein n=1 Tax=Sphingomonas sp. TaxID=28214 RepID=UPI00325FA020
GVNVVPGFLGEIADTDHAVRIAGEIGYPVMMKASAGGGGKGMRLAWSETDVRDGFEATKREGLASFGDDRVFIEKFIEQPRHIEIQLLGDQHGTILYLHERECSIQRRHQKVVEEAPSPFVSPEMRKRMGEQAVALARAVGYFSAGTVELIVSGSDTTGEGFYFLEMNTRLQVEHPVTEEITGLDLVEQMIRVAAGEPLGFTQDEVKLDGWAVETRVYAEDPYRGFLPSTGRLVRYRPPSAAQTDERRTRVDDGVVEGGEVSIFYDPMIAKLVTWAPTRIEAIDAQVEALDAFEIDGIGDNIDFLSALMQHPRFRSGEITTGFIAEEYPDGFHGAPASEELLEDLAAIAALVAASHETRAALIDGQLGGPVYPEGDYVVRVASAAGAGFGVDEFAVAVEPYDGGLLVSVDGEEEIDVIADYVPGQRLLVADLDGRRRIVRIAREGRGWRFQTLGARHHVEVMAPYVADLTQHMIAKVAPDMSRFLLAPMPGLLTKLEVKAGDKVEAGQPVAVIEAMKMENILRAPKTTTVKATPVAAGQSLAVDDIIVEFD